MSFLITDAFTEAYKDGITLRRDQEFTRLRDKVMVETGMVGASHRRDYIQSRRPTKRVSRHADTILSDTGHESRWVDLATFADADLIANPDKVKMLSDPTNPYSTAMAQGMGREIDIVTASAALGITRTGVDGTGTSLVPNHVHATTPLILDSLLEAKRRFDEAEQPENRHWAVASDDIEQLLGLTDVKSSDFNVVKVLAAGRMNSYMGFDWVRLEVPQMPVLGSGENRTFNWVDEGLWLIFGIDVQGKIDPRPDKNYSTQVFYSMTLGAARLDDDAVQEWPTQ